MLDINEVKEPIGDVSAEQDTEIPPSENKDSVNNESSEIKSSPAESEEKGDMNLSTCTEKEQVSAGDSGPPLDNTEPPSDTVIKVESKPESEIVNNTSETPPDVVKMEETAAKTTEETSETELESKVESEIVESDKIDSEKVESDKIESEKVESEKIGSEITDSEKVESEAQLETESKEEKPVIIDDPSKYKITRHYLVKWRALTYEESTWELEDDVDRDKIEQFLRFKEPPPKDKWKVCTQFSPMLIKDNSQY